jgi:Mg-chelatase subunit ChlD
MKQNHTDITIVLDRSGSMSSVADDTIGGFNRFLSDQRNAPGTAVITLHQFDDLFETPIKAQDVKIAPELTSKTFVPRGNTALLDAIGRSIVDTGARLQAIDENLRAEKVVMVIITDGQENASHEYNHAKVFEMILHQRDKYKWEFVFLGANQDAIKAATNLGMAAGNAMTYASNSKGTAAAFAATSSNLRAMRCGSAASMAYSADDRDRQAKADLQSNK